MRNNLKTNAFFDKQSSLGLKGIAIILIMFHHNFRDVSLFAPYDISFYPFSESAVVSLCYTCKICVSIFAFITGYGLYLSYEKSDDEPTKWVLRRYIRTFSRYGLIWVISAVICQIINGRTASIMFQNGKINGIFYSIIDFLGLANLFSSPTLDPTWWYMSAAAIYISIIPLLFRFKKYSWLILFWQSAFIRIIHTDNWYMGGVSAYSFLPPLILGFIFAQYNYFEKILAIGQDSRWIKLYKFPLELWVIVAFYIMYNRFSIKMIWEFHYGLFPLLIIVFYLEFIEPIKYVRRLVCFLGKHSMSIFLTHTFIRGIYLADLTYSFKHFIPITLFLLCTSLILSLIINLFTKSIQYDRLIKRLISALRFVII